MPESRKDDFSLRHPLEVRYRDVDGAGHAHHSQALVYFEEARTAYWRQVIAGPGMEEVRYVLAEARVGYHRRIFYPTRIRVGIRVSELGRKHFVMEYDARDSEDRLLLTGRTVQVLYDYEEDESIPIPGPVRARIEERDGPFAGAEAEGRE